MMGKTLKGATLVRLARHNVGNDSHLLKVMLAQRNIQLLAAGRDRSVSSNQQLSSNGLPAVKVNGRQ